MNPISSSFGENRANVIHRCDEFEIASVRHCFVGLALILPASGRSAGPWARQIASAQRIHDHSTRATSLVGWVVKLTIAIAMRRPDALIKELILEAAVQALVRQLFQLTNTNKINVV